MSNPPRAAENRGGDAKDNNNNERDKTVAKTAGLVVFSGIAMSILKALNPFNKNENSPNFKMEPLNESNSVDNTPIQSLSTTPCCQSSQKPPIQDPIFQNSVSTPVEQNVVESSAKTVEIVKGDTLWGLSREYGVSIEAIKEANGLTGDTIYAGKKLVIPS
ncbi:hypothetical protein ACJIZ3_010613 [Penstemon smallii]|uniref:LysM domain-containing protein n=1 Tax=Penstemon smallii TaxID=265156 RepID=A0ABD3UIX3_9LAMI